MVFTAGIPRVFRNRSDFGGRALAGASHEILIAALCVSGLAQSYGNEWTPEIASVQSR
jgi:hypothetical protein